MSPAGGPPGEGGWPPGQGHRGGGGDGYDPGDGDEEEDEDVATSTERSRLNIEAGCEMSEFSHGSLISTGFIFRSYAKTGRTHQNHGSQIEGTTRAVT